jgi:hypothetical protein
MATEAEATEAKGDRGKEIGPVDAEMLRLTS